MTTRGLWIDSPPAEVRKQDFWTRMRDTGFTTGAVMIESVTAGFDPKYTLLELEQLGKCARKVDMELVLTIWVEPNPAYVKDLLVKMPAIQIASGCAAIEGDVESNFTRKRLRGYPSLDAASEAAVDAIRAHRQDVRIEGTTFTEHAENSKNSEFIARCDRSMNQGYSVRNRRDSQGNDFKVPWEGTMGPGLMQRRTFERARQIPQTNGKPKLGCGLAAYDQSWPGHTIDEAMRLALNTALEYDPVECRWWSSKWLWGPNARPETLAFFRSLLA
jgi:hypothetical protein